MFNLTSNTLIHRPIKQVFEFMSMPVNDFQWQYGTLASALIPQGGAAMGRYFRSIGHLMGHRNVSTFEVTEYEPDHKYGFRSLSGPLQSNTSYRFEMENSGTRITISTTISTVNLARIRVDILEKQMKKQLKENMAKLKNNLERKGVTWPPLQ